jgi:hypothetical protein
MNGSRIIRKSLPLIGVCMFIIGALKCAKWDDSKITNPLISDYKGDYRFDVAWKGLPDTVIVGATYALACTTGRDTFADYTVTTPSDSVAQLSWKRSGAHDTLNLTFVSAYSGTIKIEAIRPNEKILLDSSRVIAIVKSIPIPVVKFPVRRLQGSINEQIKFTVLDTFSAAAKFVWQIGSASPETTQTNTMTTSFTSKDSFWVKAFGINLIGEAGSADSCFVTIDNFLYRLNINIPDTIRARRLVDFTATVDDITRFNSNGGKYYWEISAGTTKIDTTGSALTSLSFTATDSVPVQISVQAKDTLGNSSAQAIRIPLVRLFLPEISFTKLRDTLRTGVTARLSVHAWDTDPTGGGVDSILWDKDADGVIDYRSADTGWNVAFSIGGATEIIARAKDKDGFISEPDTLHLLIKSDTPYFNPAAWDTSIFINQTIKLKVNARPGESAVPIASYSWKIQGVDTLTRTTNTDTIWRTFSTAGIDTVIVSCKDQDGIVSAAADTFIVKISRGAPAVRGILPDTVWMKDDTTYRISAQDVNGTVAAYYVRWNPMEDFVRYSDSLPKYRHSTAGLKILRVYVVDNDQIPSDTITDSVWVLSGKPSVTPVFEDSVWAFDSVDYKLRGEDPNGVVKKWAISWDTDQSFEVKTDSSFTHAYNVAGAHTVRAWVMDDDSLTSDTISRSVFVKQGLPSIVSVQLNVSAAQVFVRDTVKYSIKGNDPNGSVDSILVSWDGDTVFEARIKTLGDSAALSHTFARDQGGRHSVLFRIKDDDGQIKDSLFTVNVRSGAATIDSLQTPSTVWIKDHDTYRIFGQDTNGTIIRYYFDFGNTGSWSDSSTDGIKNLSFAIAGLKTVRIGVMDDDSIVTTASRQIQVHLGMPRVWNPQGDTMFVVCPAGGGNITMRVSHDDTNGTILQYYWAFNTVDGLDTAHAYATGTLDSLIYPINPTAVNIAFKMAAFGKDDDGNVAGDTMWFYPDAPPPAPIVSHITTPDSITIYWKNKDAHDGSLTQYEILLHDGAEPDSTRPGDIISPWKTGYRISDDSGYDYMFRFKLEANIPKHLQYYQVLARDARGSENKSVIPTFSY